VRIGVEPGLGRGDALEFEEFECAGARRRAAAPSVPASRLADLLPDHVNRIKRGHRLLKDHRHLATAQIDPDAG
jgi:hypothetical protein